MMDVDHLMLMIVLMTGWHFIADVPLQPAFLASAKRVGGSDSFPWAFATFAHASMHGFGVAAITQRWELGAAEIVTHFAIDQGKCRGLYGAKEDQAQHLAWKIVWALLVSKGVI